MALDFNTAPYFDDYDKFKNYIRILFRGGHAVQARELTQLQTIFQNQLSSFADNIFEDGAVVIPGGLFYEPRISYVKINGIYSGYSNGSYTGDIQTSVYTSYEGKIIEGVTSGVKAKIQKVLLASGTDPITFYIQYIASNGEIKRFIDGEPIAIDTNATAPIAYAEVFSEYSTGYGAAFFIEEGVYYLKNAFVNVEKQTLIVQKYNIYDSNDQNIWTNALNVDIGFILNEKIVTANEDTTLNDNAQGQPNYAAPGAHRYQIEPVLTYVPIDTENENEDFSFLMKIKDGIITKKVKATDYSLLEETLARRTFDESGNYTINPFLISIGEHLKEGNNEGLFTTLQGGDNSKYYIDIQPSKAYVKGYEIEKYSKSVLEASKARDYDSFNSFLLSTRYGGWVWCYVNGKSSIPNLSQLERINLLDVASQTIGTANVRSFVPYAENGTNRIFKIYLFNIKLDSTATQDQIAFIELSTGDKFNTLLSSDITDTGFSLNDSTNSGLVFPFPYDQIKSSSDYVYDLFAYGEIGVSGSPTTISFTISNVDNLSTTEWILYGDGNPKELIAAPWISSLAPGITENFTTNNTVTFTNTAGWQSGYYYFIGKGTKTQGARRALTHNTFEEVIDLTGSNYSYANGYNYFWLGKTNVLEIVEVRKTSNGTTPATETMAGVGNAVGENVTDYFILDKNANDNFYGISKALKSQNLTITNSDKLAFAFKHLSIGSGEFIILDSYLSEPNGTYGTSLDPSIENIPLFTSSRYSKKLALSNCIDFRPVVNEAAFVHPTNVAYEGSNSGVTAEFAPTNFALPHPTDSSFQSDIDFYLSRIDKLILNYKGDFGILFGKSAVRPVAPVDREDSMTLYKMFIPAYTRYASDIKFEMIDNKRYTMRDIGNLENRIQNLEYYASLNLLEKEATQKQIKDSSGFDAYKNGFLVDPFYGTNIADASNIEFRASIDLKNKILRPSHETTNIKLMLDTSRTNTNYVIKRNQLMLNYTEEASISQPYASSAISVNPFEVFDWTGTLELSPDSDEWKETKIAPAVNYNLDGLYDSLTDIIDETGAIGTVWGEWKNNWNGASKTGKVWDVSSGISGGERVTNKTVEYNITKSREGVKTEVVPKSISTSLGERVVDVNFAPYIRSRKIKFKATRLKPNTRMYAFFENENVTDYCIKNTPSAAWYADTNSDLIIMKGKTSITYHPDQNTSNSGANFKTDENGVLEGEFYIPNNSNLKFKTGVRQFVLVDDIDGKVFNCETIAKGQYRAQGLIQRSENVSLSTKVPRIKDTAVSSGDIPTTGSKRERSTEWVGYPVAAIETVGNVINKIGGKITSIFSGGGGGFFSDVTLKENIEIIESPTDKLNKLRGVTFDWNNDVISKYEINRKEDVGLIAQDVLEVMPEAVIRDEESGKLIVQYYKIIALLVESNKELNNKISKLENQLSQKGI